MLKNGKFKRDEVDIQIIPAQPGWFLVTLCELDNGKGWVIDGVDLDRFPIIAWRVVTTPAFLSDIRRGEPDVEEMSSYAVPVTTDFDDVDAPFCVETPDGQYRFPNECTCATEDQAKGRLLDEFKRTVPYAK